MSLKEHYDSLWNLSKKEIVNGVYSIDENLNLFNDNRRGITLLARIDKKVLNNIQGFINECRIVEPDHYYYRNTDVHITVMSIITCYDGFELKSIKVDEYVNLIKKSLVNTRCFDIDLRGITSAGSSVMIQGFPSNNDINVIRDNLRNNFKLSNLEHSIDSRYPIKTAHSTIIRFKEKLADTEKFMKLLEKYREYNFGKTKVAGLELVHNDWYQRIENGKLLERFRLM